MFWTGSQCLDPFNIPPDCLDPTSTEEEIRLCIANINVLPPGELQGQIVLHVLLTCVELFSTL